MTQELVMVDASDPAITVLTMNRPEKRNALSIALIEALTAAVVAASVDRSRRVIIVRGAGAAFCAGLDLSEGGAAGGWERSGGGLAGVRVSGGEPRPGEVSVAVRGAPWARAR